MTYICIIPMLYIFLFVIGQEGQEWPTEKKNPNETDCKSNFPVKFAQIQENAWLFDFPVSRIRKNLERISNSLESTKFILEIGCSCSLELL